MPPKPKPPDNEIIARLDTIIELLRELIHTMKEVG